MLKIHRYNFKFQYKLRCLNSTALIFYSIPNYHAQISVSFLQVVSTFTSTEPSVWSFFPPLAGPLAYLWAQWHCKLREWCQRVHRGLCKDLALCPKGGPLGEMLRRSEGKSWRLMQWGAGDKSITRDNYCFWSFWSSSNLFRNPVVVFSISLHL